MTPLLIATLFFACMIIGSFAGAALQQILPDHHLDSDSRDTMKLGVGLIATLTALILGLVTADAKNSFQIMDLTMKTTTSDVLTLDRYLAQYGQETQPIRLAIRDAYAGRIQHLFGDEAPPHSPASILQQQQRFEALVEAVRALPAVNDKQNHYKAKSLEAIDTAIQKRWMFLAQNNDMGLPAAFLVALAVWLTLIFCSFGLFAPRHNTVRIIMMACGFSVAGSIFLILELGEPFGGIIHISSRPALMALEMMGQ